jgi:hypothetical protein
MTQSRIEDLARRLTREDITCKVRVGTITDIDWQPGHKVKTDITDAAWLPRDEDIALAVGDRVWILQQGPMMLVCGRLSGDPSTPTMMRKAATQTVTSSIVLVNDDDLTVDLEPGAYRVELFAHGSSTNAADTSDIRLAWTFSGTVTAARTCIGPGPVSGNITGDDTTAQTGVMRSSGHAITTSVIYGLTQDASAGIHEDISMEVTAAGTLQLQFAQGTSNATASSLTTASRMYVTPVRVVSA